MQEKQINFFVMYGQTEATARIAYLNPKKFSKKIGSIGCSIPDGYLYLRDKDNDKINAFQTTGELVYEGRNVTLGYAEGFADLIKSDINQGVLFTGDLAYFDEEGDFFLVGRESRFAKICGVRIDLEKLQEKISHIIKEAVYCVSDDRSIYCFAECDERKGALSVLVRELGIPKKCFYWRKIELEKYRTVNGKVSYNKYRL